jgi:hypothetical protein
VTTTAHPPWPHRGIDPELAAILHAITGPDGGFGHRQHVHLAFLAVRRYGMPDAVEKVCGWLRQIAVYERAPQKYHHTVSRAWVELVAHHVDPVELGRRRPVTGTSAPAGEPSDSDFDDFARRCPALLDKRLLSRHYRSSTLAADAARREWTPPDLVPFPWSA